MNFGDFIFSYLWYLIGLGIIGLLLHLAGGLDENPDDPTTTYWEREEAMD